MKWMYLVVAVAILIGAILGLIIAKNRRSRFSQKQLEIRNHSYKYALFAVFVFEAFLLVLYTFNIAVPVYWSTFGTIYVAVLVAIIYDLIHQVYLPENTRLSGNGWAWIFMIIGVLLVIPTIIKLFQGEFGLNELIDLFLATFLIALSIGRFQLHSKK